LLFYSYDVAVNLTLGCKLGSFYHKLNIYSASKRSHRSQHKLWQFAMNRKNNGQKLKNTDLDFVIYFTWEMHTIIPI